jgi:hypothetical protein
VGVRAFDFYLSLNPAKSDELQFENTLKSWLKGPGGLQKLKDLQATRHNSLSKPQKKEVQDMHDYSCQIKSCYTCMNHGGASKDCFELASLPCH